MMKKKTFYLKKYLKQKKLKKEKDVNYVIQKVNV